MLESFKIGFVQAHYYLNDDDIKLLKDTLDGRGEPGIVEEYERRFAALIGQGQGVSFAAGRMAFYSLLKALNISRGDEVILLGFTCAVMVNAVWRTGAVPVFSDIDPETFGSSPQAIEKSITPRTRIIVAQHSFGIPCDIRQIAQLGRKRGIFVVEDSAITLDSSINGIKVGNFADAALFSTDHSKPLNTLIGGLLYTRDSALYEKIKSYSKSLPDLEKIHQENLYQRILFERVNYLPQSYPRARLKAYARDVLKKIKGRRLATFLENDYAKYPASPSTYPYPAKMPAFLARLGIFELERWESEKLKRNDLLQKYITIAESSKLSAYLPRAYFDSQLEIVPLRFVFCHPDAKMMMKRMANFIDVDWFWFKQPIVCAAGSLESLGYKMNSCPLSERTGTSIINWPCLVPEGWHFKVLELFERIISG